MAAALPTTAAAREYPLELSAPGRAEPAAVVATMLVPLKPMPNVNRHFPEYVFVTDGRIGAFGNPDVHVMVTGHEHFSSSHFCFPLPPNP